MGLDSLWSQPQEAHRRRGEERNKQKKKSYKAWPVAVLPELKQLSTDL